MRNQLIIIALNFALMLILSGCSEVVIDISKPPDIPTEQLLGSPDTILVEGRKLWLSTFMWRDFMPISPPDGKPLIAIMMINAVDTIPLQATITSDAVWIVYNNQVWSSWTATDTVAPYSPNTIVKIARDGPKWGPCLNCVNVIVRVFDSNGNKYLLRAPDQSIYRTE
jgi:hypothetical protein